MKIDYQETTSDLATRIDIHNKFGGRDIDQWMLDLLKLQPDMHILDVGCGAGKQCFAYYKALQGRADITGGDVNTFLLDQARQENAQYENKIHFIELNLNQHLPFDDHSLDLVSCCFAIYYAENIPYTISEMHRLLKGGGRLFTSGPMPNNKELFYHIIREAIGKGIPPMPGSSRFASEILSEIKKQFSHTELYTFENPLTFTTVDPFIAYTRASLSEDRKLWSSFFQTKDDFERIIQQITVMAQKHLDTAGKLVMTKVVGGILASR